MSTFGNAKFAAGPYNVVYNSVACGLLRATADDQPKVMIQLLEQPIADTHLYGQTEIGAVTLGARGKASFVMKEYITGANAVIWPFTTYGGVPAVGVDMYDSYAAALVFTAAGTTLATVNGPASVTCSKARIAAGTDVPYSLGPYLREIPFLFNLHPAGSATMSLWQ